MDFAECEQHEEQEHHQPARKRQRLSAVAESAEQQRQMQQNEKIEHILYIRWHGNAGQTKLNRVGLTRLDNGVDSLKVRVMGAQGRSACDQHWTLLGVMG